MTTRVAVVVSACVAMATTMASPQARQASEGPLRPAGSIALPNVEGRIDHLAPDLNGRRVFLAALGNNTVEVIDVPAGRVTKSLTGFHEPQGIRFVPDTNRIVVANGGDGAVQMIDGGTLATVTSTALSGDADNVRLDGKTGRIYVGYGGGAIGVLDAAGKRLGDVRLAAHPEAFQLESSGPRIFVNVPGAGHIAVIDRGAQKILATWPVKQASSNYPMALDETRHRLFVGCRSPARMLVYDTESGQVVTTADIVGDTDDVFYDAATRRVIVIGGGGAITVLEQQDADHYRIVQTMATAAGARTGLWVPEWRKLFVAVPHRGSQVSELRTFEMK
jgi:DNA-binding beta-propeller fold protein YncE